MKKLLAVLLILCLMLCAGCADEAVLSEDEASKIAIEALHVRASDVSEVHIHVTTYESAPCYSVHLTVHGASYEVIVHAGTGEVLHTGTSSH